MKCPSCQREGKESTVHTWGNQTATLIHTSGYYDKSGKWVQPIDPNRYTTSYRCSNDHRFHATSQAGKAGSPEEIYVDTSDSSSGIPIQHITNAP